MNYTSVTIRVNKNTSKYFLFLSEKDKIKIIAIINGFEKTLICYREVSPNGVTADVLVMLFLTHSVLCSNNIHYIYVEVICQ